MPDQDVTYWRFQAEHNAMLLERERAKVEAYAQRVADAEATLIKMAPYRPPQVPQSTDARFWSILNAAAHACGVDPQIVLSERQDREASEPRMIAYRLMRDAGLKVKEIGQRLGGRDHSTVIAGAKATAERARVDPEFAARLGMARKLVASLYTREDAHADVVSS